MQTLTNVLFLILFPFIAAALVWLTPEGKSRTWVIRVMSAIIAAGSVMLAWSMTGQPAQFFVFESSAFEHLLFPMETLMTLAIIWLGFKYKKFAAPALAVIQFGIMLGFEMNFGAELRPQHNLYVDQLSLIMALVIGIVGVLICLYSASYMKDYHRHYPRLADRRGYFYFVIFAFLGAMFGLVFSNNLLYMLFFWEITTLTSFLLIGYTRTQEAVDNSFTALVMNLGGGIAFALAIFILYNSRGIIELDKVLSAKSVVLLPVALMCFAGLTKAAQMPFSKWLLGAMVAPTPTSALLHSSTMVKAGVFLLLKLAPVMEGTIVGDSVALIGGLTFLLTSLINLSERNIKKVLAYSTVANLGLMVACAGLGSYQAVWVGVMFIVFHAVGKSLLFLVVGTTENKFYTKDMENYDNMIVRMPRVALIYIIGIAGMYVAPFGLVISKWAAIEAILQSNSLLSPILMLMLAFGSSATVFYWTQLLGKIVAVRNKRETDRDFEKGIGIDEWIAEWSHAGISVVVCVLFPLISVIWVEPYLMDIYGQSFGIGAGNYAIMLIMLAMLVLIPLAVLGFGRQRSYGENRTYMAGRDMDRNYAVEGSIGSRNEVTLKNYYPTEFFAEAILLKAGNSLCVLMLVFLVLGDVIWKR
ncbi:MAG: proton-conducting transporter membrane subunit [Elusimicrobiaceae bacterium]|nr:proton-conducting transporter membrane subunit [Elusimicrobiaceae bacterium]